MEMIQTYQGYFQEDGRFIADNLLAQIPIGRRAIVNILDDEIAIGTKPNSQKQKENALIRLFADAEKAESALSNAEWTEFENLRSQTNLTREVGV